MIEYIEIDGKTMKNTKCSSLISLNLNNKTVDEMQKILIEKDNRDSRPLAFNGIVVPTEAYENYLKSDNFQNWKSCFVPDINVDNDNILNKSGRFRKLKRTPNYKKALKYLRKVVKYLPKELKIELKLEQQNESKIYSN